MEDDIDYILVAPGHLQFVLFENGDQILLPLEFSHPCEVHQHNTGIHTWKTEGIPTWLSKFKSYSPNWQDSIIAFVPWFSRCHLILSWFSKTLTQFSVERMPSKSVVPSCVWILVFRRQGSQLSRVHYLKILPNIFRRRQEEYIGINVKDWVNVCQQALEQKDW